MIDPKPEDIGRRVFYTGNRYPGGTSIYGRITSINDHYVFVDYHNTGHGIATSRADLEWDIPK